MLQEEDIEHSDEEGGMMDLDDDDTPSFEFRLETAKLLMELDPTTETAVHVSPPLALPLLCYFTC